jgi:hypothetical protein
MAEPCQKGKRPSGLRRLQIVTMMNMPINVPMKARAR